MCARSPPTATAFEQGGWSRVFIQRMHDSIMAHTGVDHEHHNGQEKYDTGYGDNSGWVEINNNNYNSSQNQSPIYENESFGLPSFSYPSHGLPSESSFPPPRMPHTQSPPNHYSNHQQLLPLIMPSHTQTTWPSMLTNPVTSSIPPVAIPPVSVPPQTKGNLPKLPAIHTAPSPRKTLTDSDRRRMCQYHEENPTVKQTEIGGKKENHLSWKEFN